MQCHKPDKLARGYDLGFLPESRKMPKIAGDQVIRAGNIGTFQEPITIGVACHFEAAGRSDGIAMIFDELQQLSPKTLADFELYSSRIGGDIKARGLRNR